MKKLYALLLAMSGAGIVQAQITLDASSYTNVTIIADTVGVIGADRPDLTPSSTAQFFDFNFIGYSPQGYYYEQASGTNAAMPDATYWENRGYQQGADSFKSKRWSGITSTGIIRFGESIERQVVSLHGVIGGTPDDSLVILAQDAVYSTPYKLIPFPTTYGDSWSSDFTYEVNMELTLGAGYVQAPFVQKSSVSYDFEAVGYGHFEMIKRDDGYGQAEVLMVRVKSETIDSFFVNGSPAPDGLLTSMGMVQGRSNKVNFDELFRANEVTPLVLYNYGSDATFTNVVSNQVHQDRLAFATGIAELTKAPYPDGNDVKLFPNVVDGNTKEISLYLPLAQAGTYTYAITNVEGKTVYQTQQEIQRDGKAIMNIGLPANMINGAYWLKLYNANGKQITVQPLRYAAQ